MIIDEQLASDVADVRADRQNDVTSSPSRRATVEDSAASLASSVTVGPPARASVASATRAIASATSGPADPPPVRCGVAAGDERHAADGEYAASTRRVA
jgi:hypothetical protein